jgi:hypothetical protein
MWPELEGANKPFHLISRCFKVSPLVAARRALDLKMIEKERFFAFYHEQQSEWKAQRMRDKESGSGGNFYATQNVRLGRRFATVDPDRGATRLRVHGSSNDAVCGISTPAGRGFGRRWSFTPAAGPRNATAPEPPHYGRCARFGDGRWTTVGNAEGYPAAEAFAVYEDRAGALWAGTAAGVYRRAKTQFGSSRPAARRGLPWPSS